MKISAAVFLFFLFCLFLVQPAGRAYGLVSFQKRQGKNRHTAAHRRNSRRVRGARKNIYTESLEIFDEGPNDDTPDFSIDTSQDICETDPLTLEDFFQTELKATIHNERNCNIKITKVKYLVRNLTDGSIVWRSKKLSTSFVSIPPGESQEVYSVLAAPKGSFKAFIESSPVIYLKDHTGALNLRARFTGRDAKGNRVLAAASQVIVPANLYRCR